MQLVQLGQLMGQLMVHPMQLVLPMQRAQPMKQ
jgi:hypothetical protein